MFELSRCNIIESIDVCLGLWSDSSSIEDPIFTQNATLRVYLIDLVRKLFASCEMKACPFFIGRKTQVSPRKAKKVYVIVLCALCFLFLDLQLGSIQQPAVGDLNPRLYKKSLLFRSSKPGDGFLNNRKFLEMDDNKHKIDTTKNISQFDSSSNLRFASSLTLIIVVCSHPEHVQLRQTIRATWGSDVKHLDGAAIVFLLGLSADESWRELTRREMAIHGDIVQVDVVENYRSLARKVIQGMNWVTENVPNVKYYMKCDDDVYINVPYLLRELHSGVISSTQILGALSPNAQVIRDHRDEWSVPYNVYPAKTFPPYVAGGAYVMSKLASKLILKVLPNTNLIHLEDVFITGVLGKKAGLSHVGHEGFSFWSSSKAKPCDIISSRRITSVNMSAKRISKLYSDISELLSRSENSCSNNTSI